MSASENRVRHCEILAKDVKALHGFYTEAFGWATHDVVEGGYHIMAPPGSDLDTHVGIGPAPADSAGHVTFHVEVDDPARTLEQIERLGGRTVQPPVKVSGGPTIALFADPEGHVIGLVERHQQAG